VLAKKYFLEGSRTTRGKAVLAADRPAPLRAGSAKKNYSSELYDAPAIHFRQFAGLALERLLLVGCAGHCNGSLSVPEW